MKSSKFSNIIKSGVLIILMLCFATDAVYSQATEPSDLVVTQVIGDNDGYGYALGDGTTLPATEHPEGNWYFDNRTESELADPYAKFTDYELPDHPNALLIHNIDISLFSRIDSAVLTVDISGLHTNRKCRMFIENIEQLEFASLPSFGSRGSGIYRYSVDPGLLADGELIVEFRRQFDINGPKWGDDWALDYVALSVYGQGSTVSVPLLISPENEISLPESQPTFLWTGDADYYHFQLATDVDFLNVIDEEWPISTTYTSPTTLSEGSYFWRVAGHSQWQVSDFSEIRSFNTIGPKLSVDPTSLDYGIDIVSLDVTIINTGFGYLSVNAVSNSSWIVLEMYDDSLGAQSSGLINVSIDRNSLLPGEYTSQVEITSNGGDAIVEISMGVSAEPVLYVSPFNLNFGSESNEQIVSITNLGGGILEWSINSDQDWIGFTPSSGSQNESIMVTVNRSNLVPGDYTGTITISSNAGTKIVEVLMTISEPPEIPELSVEQIALDFGSSNTEQSFTIKNIGTGTLLWNVTDDQSWIETDITQGSSTTETDLITVTIHRENLPPSVYDGLINVTSNGGDHTISVTMEVLEQPVLEVAPLALDFGTAGISDTIVISNAGTGTLTWSALPEHPWIVLSPLSGDITTDSTLVSVSVNREGLIADDYSGTIDVTSNGGSSVITVAMIIEQDPLLSVQPLNLNFDRTLTQLIFDIANDGGGELNWTITVDQPWISLGQSSGTTKSEIDAAIVTVDRSGMTPGLYSGLITVDSDYGTAVINVTMAINDWPAFTGGLENSTIVEWSQFQRVVTATDPDGDNLQIICVDPPFGAVFVDNGDGSGLFSFVPDYQYVDQDVLITFEVSDGLVSTPAEMVLSVENLQLQVGHTATGYDLLVNDQINIPFNEPIRESSLSANLVITSAHGAPLQYDYFGFGATTPSLIIHPPVGELFMDMDTITVRLIGGANGILDMAGVPLESDYSETFITGAAVYPGDIDHNGVVDERDILPIGLYFNQTGPPRDEMGILWKAYYAHVLTPFSEWSPTAMVYADADGNGVINADDICAVTDNWLKMIPGMTGLKLQPSDDDLLVLNKMESSTLTEIYRALSECPGTTGAGTIIDMLDNVIGAGQSALPTEFSLHQNYPNPFNPETEISFDLPNPSHARVSVYDVAGHLVTVLWDKHTEAGVHSITWNGCDGGGQRVASGVYLYRLATDTESITRRMLLLK